MCVFVCVYYLLMCVYVYYLLMFVYYLLIVCVLFIDCVCTIY